jgi:WD40 repeat protein
VLPILGYTAISPDGRWIVDASRGTVRIWDVLNGPEGLSIDAGPTTVFDLAFSPDGRRLAAAVADGSVKLCDSATGEVIRTFSHQQGSVHGVAFSPNGRFLATASADKTVKVWDADSGKRLFSLEGHTKPVWRVVFSPNGGHVATTSADETVRLWNAATGQLVHTLEGNVDYPNGAAFSPDSQRLASVVSEGKKRYRIMVWDVGTGKESKVTLPPQPDEISTPVFSADGSRIIAQVGEHGTKAWDANTGTEILSLPLVTTLVTALSPDGRRLAAFGSGNSVQMRDTATGEVILTLRGHKCPVTAIAFSPDGHRLASGDHNGTVRIWDGTPLAER